MYTSYPTNYKQSFAKASIFFKRSKIDLCKNAKLFIICGVKINFLQGFECFMWVKPIEVLGHLILQKPNNRSDIIPQSKSNSSSHKNQTISIVLVFSFNFFLLQILIKPHK